MNYSIRQATIKDLAILDRIHTENMQGYVEKVYPWNSQLFRNYFVSEDYQIIEIKGQIIGFFKITRSTTDIYLGEIQIETNYQKQGIGTAIIKSIIKEAKKNHQRLWLKVIRGNPAERLYRRLGFIVFEESHTHRKMEINF